MSPYARRGGVMIWLVLLIILAVVVGGGYAAYRSFSKPATSALTAQSLATHRVTRGSFDMLVIANGEIEAKNKVEIKNEVDGNTTIIDVVPEGTQVKKGDVLIRLADDDIRDKIETETLSVEQAQTDKLAAEQDHAIQLNEADSDLKAAELKLELAKLDLEKWTLGDDPKKTRELNVAVQKATRNLQRAKEELEASEQLYKEDFISRSELEDDRLDVIEAESALKTAMLDVEVYKKYTKPKEQKKVQSDVDEAAAALERTKRRNQSKIAQSQAKLQGKIRTLAIREDRLEKLHEQLSFCVVKAPQNGMVIYATTVGGWRRRNDPIVQGKSVRKNESLIVLPDTSQMVASVKVHESLVGQLKAGQKAMITIDATPGQPIGGEVYEIGVMATNGGWMNPDLREYTVKIDLPPSSGEDLKPAMRCSSRILTGRVENVLFVPIQCVVTVGKQSYVYVREGDQSIRRKVTTGRSNESIVAILDGIEEGDRVMMVPPAQVEQAGKGKGKPGNEKDAEGATKPDAKPKAADKPKPQTPAHQESE
ncbi:MAG: efflux RND transporter periplasmic adaptor subunit [Phycisphaeraceae bacterium JB051]